MLQAVWEPGYTCSLLPAAAVPPTWSKTQAASSSSLSQPIILLSVLTEKHKGHVRKCEELLVKSTLKDFKEGRRRPHKIPEQCKWMLRFGGRQLPNFMWPSHKAQEQRTESLIECVHTAKQEHLKDAVTGLVQTNCLSNVAFFLIFEQTSLRLEVTRRRPLPDCSDSSDDAEEIQDLRSGLLFWKNEC